MDTLDHLKEVLTEDRAVRPVDDSIYSVLSDAASKHHYDRRATLYDLVVSTRLYNSIMWEVPPSIMLSLRGTPSTLVPKAEFWMLLAAHFSLPLPLISRVNGQSSPSTSH